MMTPAEAASIVGKQPDGDYRLDLLSHAGHYDRSAPGLAALLRSARLAALAEEYKERGERAAFAQTAYKTTMERANRAVFAAAVLSASMMAAQIVMGRWTYGPWLVAALGVFSAASGALAAMWLFRVRDGNMLEAWMTRRAAAETARLSYFTALAPPSEQDEETRDLNLLRLEYFRRYQLEVQKNYYKSRGEAHELSADRTLRWGSYAVLCSAIASVVSGGLGAVQGVATALGFVGVFGAALSGYASASEAMSQDRRNAERYDRTLTALAELGGRLDEVRTAVANGNERALAEYIAAINEQISLEHRQWLEGSEATKAAAARIDDALGKIQQSTQRNTIANQ